MFGFDIFDEKQVFLLAYQYLSRSKHAISGKYLNL